MKTNKSNTLYYELLTDKYGIYTIGSFMNDLKDMKISEVKAEFRIMQSDLLKFLKSNINNIYNPESWSIKTVGIDMWLSKVESDYPVKVIADMNLDLVNKLVENEKLITNKIKLAITVNE